MWKLKSNLRQSAPPDADTASVFFERMEPRILFSADALAGLVAADPFADNDSANAGMNVRASASFLVELYTPDESSIGSQGPTDAERALQFDALREAFDAEDMSNESADSLDSLETLLDGAESGTETRQEIIFVDAATPDYQQLLTGLNTDSPDTDYQIFILQSDRDGIEQITEILGGFDTVDAIHLVSHGNEQGIQLGNGWLDQSSLDGYAEVIGSWSTVLDEEADILIYGCNLAAGISGQHLIGSLAELTGADVSASDDLTGAVTLGGDWELEHQIGQIETTLAFNSILQQNWNAVLGTFVVDSTADTIDSNPGDNLAMDASGNTTLRAAIMEANALGGSHNIVLGAGNYTLTLGSAGEDAAAQGDLDILSDITISGADAATTIIDASGIVGGDRVFEIGSGASLNMTEVTVEDGSVSGGGNSGRGGGFYVDTGATLSLKNVVVQNNRADDGGGIMNHGLLDLTNVSIANNGDAGSGDGGGLNNRLTATLDNVTFSGNQADRGGAIANEGADLTLNNVTLSGNTAATDGGAIYNFERLGTPGTLSITNSTLTGNTSAGVNGISQDLTSSLDIKNTILNDGGSNISGGIVNSLGNNIDSDGSAGLGGPGDQVGNPMLDVLADNGGFTQTHALLSGSIAINTGDGGGAPVADQRGQIRIGSVDVGAYEFTDYGLIWGDVATDSISIATLDGNHVTDLITGLDDPASVAIDPGAGKVYWANDGDGKIQRANLDGTGVEDVITGLSGPIAIDLYIAGRKIYWTDASGNLSRANLDGSLQEIISGNPVASTGVAVDGPGGMVYWVDDGSNSIGETSLTGTGTGDLVTSSVNNTADLELDLVNGKIYWTNLSTGQLLRANLSDGSSFESAGVGGTPYGLALDPVGNKTYWTDSAAGELYRVDLSNGANRITLYSGLADPRDVDFFSLAPLTKSITAPTATNLNSTSVYTEGDASVPITDIVVTDVDFGEIITATLTLADTSTGILSANDGASYNGATGIWSIKGTVADVNTALANLVFEPATNNDLDSFISVSIDDGDEDASGPLTGIIDLDVTPVNDAPSVSLPGVFISELHYDNAGVDSGEAIEIMGPAGTDLTGWSLVLYSSGNGNIAYHSEALSGTIADQANGFGTLAFNFPVNGIQNGVSDGIALIDASSNVLQFISYEGTLTAVDGPAAGLTSTDIGVAEDGLTLVGDSLQLTGTGSELTWAAASANSFGAINTGISASAVDSGVEDTDNVYTHAQMLNLLGASDVDDVDANLTIDITNLVNGTLVMSGGTGGLGTTFTFTPTPEFSGQLTFDYQVFDDDSAGSAIGNGIINIAAVNDAPTATNLSSTSAYFEGDASVAITDIVVSDVDAGETITATLTLVDTATGSLSANDGASYTPGTGVWTITDTVANVNTALANLVFNPLITNTLDTSIDVNIDDGDEDASGALTGSITLDVTPVNNPPTATNLSSTSAYGEGAASVAITNIVVSDVDAGETITATLTLADTSTGSLSANDGATYTPGTGVWTITDTVVNVNTALANLVFNPNTDNDVDTSIAVSMDDGDEDLSGALTGTITLDVTPINDAPTATNLSSTSAYNEGDASVPITDIVVSDVDAGETITATLTLADTSTGSLSANDGATYTPGTGIWTLTDTVANVNTALANLVFTPNVNNDVDTSIAVSIDDGDEDGSGALTGTITLDVTPVNDAPTATNLSSTSSYNEGDPTVAITDIVVSDVDAGEVITATLTLADTATGILSANDGATYTPGTGIWTITDTVTNVNTALANLVFTPNVNNDVDTSIDVNIDDGDEDSSGALTGTITLDVTPINDPPTATNLNSTSAYNEGDPTVAITDIVVSDVDSAEAITATLTLADTSTGSLSANDGATYDGLTGIWTITDTVANVNTALANLVFNPAVNNDVNTSIDVNIDDGDEDLSGALTGTIDLDVTPVNDAPTATNLSSTSVYNEGDPTVAITDIVVSDVDAGEIITATLTLADIATGSLSANDGATYDGLTGIWTITDTVANVNTALANLVFNPTVNNEVDTSIDVNIDDGDEDLSGALTGTITLDVTPVNDAPTATNLSSTSAYNEGDPTVAITDIVVSDVDAGEIITATLTLADTATGSLSANDGATYDGLTGIWTLTDTVANVNTALANLVFNPTLTNIVDTGIDVNIDDGDEDGSGALTGTITLDVTPINDAPTATNLASGSTYNQGDASLPLNDIVITDTDAGETVTATLTLANIGSGSLSGNDGATYNATTGVWTITGTVAQVNTALANLEFIPTASNTLDTTIAISIDDGDEDGSGPLIGAMTITVNPLPVVEPPVDPPIIESEPDDPVEIPETEPPVEAPVEEVVVELTKDNPLLVVGSGPVIADGNDDPAPSLLADSVVEFIDPDARVDNSEVPPETSVAKPVGVETLLIKLREQLEFFDDPMQLIGAESFITKLNDMREALVSETENTEKVIGSSLTVTAGFSVGYVVWLARSGVLLSSVLSSLPAWRFIDPLPVLAGLQGGKGDDDEESLESMVEEKPVDDASQDAAVDDKSDA